MQQRGPLFIIPADYNDVTEGILSSAIEVHRTYMPCLQFELTARKLRWVTQRAVPIVYKGIAMEASYRIDLVVEDCVVVEVKSAAALMPVHEAQLLTYMRLTEDERTPASRATGSQSQCDPKEGFSPFLSSSVCDPVPFVGLR